MSLGRCCFVEGWGETGTELSTAVPLDILILFFVGAEPTVCILSFWLLFNPPPPRSTDDHHLLFPFLSFFNMWRVSGSVPGGDWDPLSSYGASE